MKLSLVAALAVLTLTAQGCYRRECKNARDQVVNPTTHLTTYLQTNPSAEQLAQSGCTTVLNDVEKLPKGASTIRKLANRRYTHSTSQCVAWATGFRRTCYGYGGGYPYQELDSEVVALLDSSEEKAHPRPIFRPIPGPRPPIYQPRPIPRPPVYPRPGPRPPIYPNPGYPGNPGYQPGYPGYPGGYPACRWVPYSYCSAWNYDTQVEPGYREAMELAQELDLVFAKAHQTCQLVSQGQAEQAYAASRELANYLVTEAQPDAISVYGTACNR